MTLLDTNVLIYAFDADSPLCEWASEKIADAVAGDGGAINAVSLAELCVGDEEPSTVADRVRSWGVEILDVPGAAADACARAFRRYRERRMTQSGMPIADTPLPDFFIGAHAMILGVPLATADRGRFDTYFPGVVLETPP
ncbi:MAG TPA: PIN domain-containing protein [Vicinamibacteria bacterium]|nr:PIN domain-containing protein [Vicinamibacteria bacterium]